MILHQVRNPLDAIASCQTITDPSWEYISNFVPIYNDESLVYRCMQYWLHWNRLARESSTWTYKIEELPEQYDNFCKKIKREDLITQEKKDIIAVFNKNLNTRDTSYRKLKREDLFNCSEELAEEIVKDGAYYGYSI